MSSRERWEMAQTLNFGKIFGLVIARLLPDRFINGVWVWDWSRELTSCRHQALLQDLKLVIDSFVWGGQMDSWACTISKQSCYLVKDGRMMIDNMLLPSNGHSTRWINTLPRKVNIFMWRVELNKLPSRLNLSKKGLEIMHIDCPSCGFSVESTEHVLFECPIASQVWSRVQLWTNVDMPHFCSWNQGLAWLNNWNFTARVKDHMFIIMAAYMWIMWRYRNNVIFGENKMKKADLFDSICNFSFNWIRLDIEANVHLGSLRAFDDAALVCLNGKLCQNNLKSHIVNYHIEYYSNASGLIELPRDRF
ncbi:uncharacterized protein [Rutidosis leptorrhynchoides]|uniref:uncharacterized protein n=1 Tax=Rutidosis leptorrhynchoides TaxID=125765 RepID=UPI003A99ACFA